jgi:hypothetical protein
MSKRLGIGFIRKANGVLICMPKCSTHLTFEEIGRLSRFIASGDDVSSRELRRALAAEKSDEGDSVSRESGGSTR